MKPFRNRNPLPIALVGITVLALLIVASLNSDSLPVIGGGTTYTAETRGAVGLKADDSVRIGGVKVGKVEDVTLDGQKVKVTFRVKDAFVGDQSQAAIKMQTLLGQKYLSVESKGSAPRDPSKPMTEDTAQSVFLDVQDAFSGLSDRVHEVNTDELAQSFETLSDTFKDTPANVRSSLNGLSRLSKTISSRDTQLAQLLNNTKQITRTLSDRDAQVEKLLGDGSSLLKEIQLRKQAIDNLLTSTQSLSKQLNGLIDDNNAQLKPVLTQLNQVTTMLQRNQTSLAKGIQAMAPFARVFNNALGNGRWFDGYVCNLIPTAGATNPQGCTPH